MKKAAYTLVPLLLIYLAFLVWHTPLRGPLTDAEVDAFLEVQAEQGLNDWAISEEFENFLRNDDGRPFIMVNLMEVRDLASYPDGVATDNQTGSDADAAYGRAVLPLLLSRGSYPVANAARSYTIINSLGQTAGSFDTVAMVRYRSRRDLVDMISSDAFLAAEVHKWASLENTLVAPARRMPSLNLIGYVPMFILLLGAFSFGRFRSGKGQQVS